jgi:phospholipid/cholesterol/gamma-HCH transport system substrate-binding protein
VTAIRKHLGDFAALIVLFVIGIGAAAYILSNQRLRFPIIEEKPLELKAEMSDAQAVIPGQGQTVRVAGVKVGDIGKVELKEGRAYVTLQIDPQYKDLIKADASALLRPKTGLKDMLMEVEPGNGKPLANGGIIPITNTAPDIDPDEFLSALDRDTRDYLKLLIGGAGKGLKGNGENLREVWKQFEPLHRDLARVTQAIAERRTNLRRLVHNYQGLVTELGDHDRDIVRLVRASNVVMRSFASEDQNVSLAVSRLPGALSETAQTLGKVRSLATTMGPALESLRPAFRQLDTANKEVLPFVKEAEPTVRTKIRPFVRAARPYVQDLKPAAKNLAEATPDFEASFHELNRFFNMAAYNPGGAEPLPGNEAGDRKRDEGYLFWASWIAQNTVSLFNSSDAGGPFRRAITQVSCSTVREIVTEEPSLGILLGLTDVLATPGLCAQPDTPSNP